MVVNIRQCGNVDVGYILSIIVVQLQNSERYHEVGRESEEKSHILTIIYLIYKCCH